MSMLNKKRKITQSDLRMLMLEKKRKLIETKKKIDSPFAKYLDNGTLLCMVCNSTVRTEAIWNIHINSKQHRDNVLIKESKDKLPALSTKSISTSKKESSLETTQDSVKLKSILRKKEEKRNTEFVHIGCEESKPSIHHIVNQMDVDIELTTFSHINELPEGFFDDPVMDAKARNVDYRNPIDEEWDKFQREIQEENILSEQILDEDQETAAAEKETDRIDKQMELWSRVQILEERIEDIQKKTVEKKVAIHSPMLEGTDENDDSSYGSDEDFDEYIDWRSKRAFK